MSLIVVGLSHKTAPVELREHLAVPAERLSSSLAALREAHGLSEAVILSTCNRLEIYGRPAHQSAAQAVGEFMQNLYARGDIKGALYHYEAESAIRHLFRVASGLDSLVVGETEVLGQVKSAYQRAKTDGVTGKITNVLFQRALYVGKQVRQKTAISEGSTSVGSVAVHLAERIFGSLNGRHILLLGAGKMAEIASRHLLSQKATGIVILNRTRKRAENLAALLGGRPASFDDLIPELERADIVIGSAKSEQPLISKEMVETIMKARRGRSLYFIDIAVPRNIEASVHEIDNAYVYNIDDLKALLEEHLARRRQDISAAESIVEESAREFHAWVDSVLKGETPALRHKRASL